MSRSAKREGNCLRRERESGVIRRPGPFSELSAVGPCTGVKAPSRARVDRAGEPHYYSRPITAMGALRRRTRIGGGLRALFAVCVLLAPASPAAGQVVEGVLMEDGSDRVVRFGSVALLHEDRSVAVTSQASITGRFSLEAPEPGAYYVYAIALGYRATLDGLFELGRGDTLRIQFRVPADAVPIDSLSVTVAPRRSRLDRSGFYERRRTNMGLFLTEADVLKTRAFETSDIFRKQPGAWVSPVSSSRLGFTQNRVLLRNGCVPAFFMDGNLIRRAGESGLHMDEFVRPDEIAGIEIYRGSSEIPLEYGGPTGPCGIVVIWTH